MNDMTIKVASRQAGVVEGTIRTYERLGLIAPRRNSAGQRLFGPEDVAVIRRIAAERRANRGSGLRSAKAARVRRGA